VVGQNRSEKATGKKEGLPGPTGKVKVGKAKLQEKTGLLAPQREGRHGRADVQLVVH